MRRLLAVMALFALWLGTATTQAKADEVVYLSKEKVMAKMTDPGVRR